MVLQDLEMQPNLGSAGRERKVGPPLIPVNSLAANTVPHLVGGIEDNAMVDGA